MNNPISDKEYNKEEYDNEITIDTTKTLFWTFEDIDMMFDMNYSGTELGTEPTRRLDEKEKLHVMELLHVDEYVRDAVGQGINNAIEKVLSQRDQTT